MTDAVNHETDSLMGVSITDKPEGRAYFCMHGISHDASSMRAIRFG